jgi:hypothetical protein
MQRRISKMANNKKASEEKTKGLTADKLKAIED